MQARQKQGKSRAKKSADPNKSLQLIQHDLNIQINELIAEVLEDINGIVKVGQARQLVAMMNQQFKFFKTSFILLIDKILVLEEKDKMIKGVYNLISKFIHELAKDGSLNKVDVNTLLTSFLDHLIQTYFLQKCPLQVQSRTAFLVNELALQYGLQSLKMDGELKIGLQDLILDLLQQTRSSTLPIYGVGIACQIINQNNPNDQLYMNLMRLMTHSNYRDVRRACIQNIKTPLSQISLLFLGKRLRDKDDEIRRLTFQKLTKSHIKLDDFQSSEQRMLIIKEGLTDQNEGVRWACIEFLEQSLVKEDLSCFFKLIDCKLMFVKEYYIQIPFLIMRLIFHFFKDDQEEQIAQYIEKILNKLKIMSGVIVVDSQHLEISFEEILFLRIAYEFTKMYKSDRQDEYIEYLDNLTLCFDDYKQIFDILLNSKDRLIFSEWVKFSLQLPIEEEVTRQNLVTLIFSYIGQIQHSYNDYKHLLKLNRFLLNDNSEGYIDNENELMEDDFDDIVQENEQQVIEIEIREFRDLDQRRDIQEYCKPFSFESLVRDSDDVCRIAVIVARKLLDNRIDEFSLSMLQCISDIKEQLEESEDLDVMSFKRQKDKIQAKLDEKLDQLNMLFSQEEYDIREINNIIRSLHRNVSIMEELNLKEKLSFKRALNLCLILLKQCRADVNDQNLVSICDTLLRPSIQSKDKDNMILALEAIGLLCLLDKELFINYSPIFQSILNEDVQDNQREKIIALKASVDSLIIHGTDNKTAKLQEIIIEDYMVIKDKVLRQTTIEGICKMLFSRKLTQDTDHNDMEFLLSQLIIQWFDKKYNWQNSLVRQVLNTFFKSFVLFSQQRCEIMLQALLKVIYSILESKYENHLQIKKKPIKKRRSSHEDSDDYSVDDDSGFVSDDSRCQQSQAYMQNICSQLDPVQITKIFMLLLSKDYVNQNATKQFKLTKDLTIDFLLSIAYLNSTKFKKVSIVKEYLVHIVDYVKIQDCEDLQQLTQLGKYIDLNSKMLVQGHPKLRKLKEALDKRIEVLKKEESEYKELLGVEVKDEQQISQQLVEQVVRLNTYFKEEILGTLIDLVQDDDEDYQELQNLQIEGLKPLLQSPIVMKNKRQSQDQQSLNMNLRRRKSGLRSNKKNQRFNSEVNGDNKLKVIPEENGAFKDMSSSEKPKLKHKLIMNETILEEQDSLVEDQDMDEQISDSSESRHRQLKQERLQRKGLMSKLSKKMARDFQVTKKQSLLSQQSSCTQINEMRQKEEYMDGRTVYKISKQKSPSVYMQQSHSQQAVVNENQRIEVEDNIAHNLSVRFDNLDQLLDTAKKHNHSEILQEMSLSSIKKETSKNPKTKKSTKSTRDNGVVNRSYENRELFKPELQRMTRSRMKSVSSYSKNDSYNSDSESSDSGFNLMESGLSKKNKQVAKAKQQQQKSVLQPKTGSLNSSMSSNGGYMSRRVRRDIEKPKENKKVDFNRSRQK